MDDTVPPTHPATTVVLISHKNPDWCFVDNLPKRDNSLVMAESRIRTGFTTTSCEDRRLVRGWMPLVALFVDPLDHFVDCFDEFFRMPSNAKIQENT